MGGVCVSERVRCVRTEESESSSPLLEGPHCGSRLGVISWWDLFLDEMGSEETVSLLRRGWGGWCPREGWV